MEPSRREFKIPLARTLPTFGQDRKSVPVRHEDKAMNPEHFLFWLPAWVRFRLKPTCRSGCAYGGLRL